MLERFGRKQEPDYDDAIERILYTMNEHPVGSEEYKHAIIYLQRVTDAKAANKPADRVSRDTVVIVAGNILGIILVVFAEQNHVIVSKALSFILKPKSQSITV